MKNRLGLFEDPFAGMEGEEQLSAEAKKIALALACESSVLLKNADLLPLKPEQKVFWAGPYVESTELLSRWAIFGRHDDVETISEVLRDRKLPVRFVPGCEILTEEERRLWQADNCRIQGEEEQNKEMSGSCGDQYADLEEIDRRIQWYLCLENMKHSPVRRRAGHFLIFRKVSRSFLTQ